MVENKTLKGASDTVTSDFIKTIKANNRNTSEARHVCDMTLTYVASML